MLACAQRVGPGILLAVCLATQAAADPVVIVAPSARGLVGSVQQAGLETAVAVGQETSSESVLSAVRPLYRDMSFQKCAEKISQAEDQFVRNKHPEPRLVSSLAQLELWYGACLLLSRNSKEANERFAFAQRLEPAAKPDALFPPEVHEAFRNARSERIVNVMLRVAPDGARVWIDGKLVSGNARAVTSPGLHYVVVERADKKPFTAVLRITAAAPEVAANLQDNALPADAINWVAMNETLVPTEGVALAGALNRPVWFVSQRNNLALGDRFDAQNAAANRHVESSATDGKKFVLELCRNEPACKNVESPDAGGKRPVWKRGWFWATIAVSAVAVAGIVTGAVLATSPRDYALQIR